MYPTKISFFLTRDTRSIWVTPHSTSADPRRKTEKKRQGGVQKWTAPAEVLANFPAPACLPLLPQGQPLSLLRSAPCSAPCSLLPVTCSAPCSCFLCEQETGQPLLPVSPVHLCSCFTCAPAPVLLSSCEQPLNIA